MPRILVVDDNEVIRGMLRHIFSRIGHEVVADVGTGAEALAAYDAHKPDLVSLDVSLPDMSGLEVLKVLRAKDPAARVVIVTGNNAAVLRRDAMALGAKAVLLKPFDAKALEKAFGGAA